MTSTLRGFCSIIVILKTIYPSAAQLYRLNLGGQQSKKKIESPEKIRTILSEFLEQGRVHDIVSYLDDLEKEHGTLLIDDKLPSLYTYKGVALHNSQRIAEAATAFQNGLKHFPNDTRSWINLGEAYTQEFRLNDAIKAFSRAAELGDRNALTRLLKAKGWSDNWKDFERISAEIERDAELCYKDYSYCNRIDSSSGLEYTGASGAIQRFFHSQSPNSRSSSFFVRKEEVALLWYDIKDRDQKDRDAITTGFGAGKDNSKDNSELGLASTGSAGTGTGNERKRGGVGIGAAAAAAAGRTPSKKSPSSASIRSGSSYTNRGRTAGVGILQDDGEESATEVLRRKNPTSRRIKVGLMSSDFGVHPVAQLIRGAIEYVDKRYIELFCFALTPKVSWWGENITAVAEHFVWLQGMNTLDAAASIAARGIEILIDLNGHTQNSGLPVMAHRPSPIQLSFLGLPTTTGAPFVDYYLADYIAVPAEHADHYSEKLILMAPCYIANDYANTQGAVLNHNIANGYRAPRSVLKADVEIENAPILFGTLSNSQKIDHWMFKVWMNILSSLDGSKLVFMSYLGSDFAIPNIRNYSAVHGVKSDRIGLASQSPWLDHLYTKTAFDFMLDTSSKNGHTTGLDAVWAGVPTLSVGSGSTAPARAAESIAVAMGSEMGISYSLKEYEDMVLTLADASKSTRSKHHEWRETMPGVIKGKEDIIGDIGKGETEAEEGEEESTKRKLNPRIPGSERLRLLREHHERLRETSPLFDTRSWSLTFSRLLQATWEAAHITLLPHDKLKASADAEGDLWGSGSIQQGDASGTEAAAAVEGIVSISSTKKKAAARNLGAKSKKKSSSSSSSSSSSTASSSSSTSVKAAASEYQIDKKNIYHIFSVARPEPPEWRQQQESSSLSSTGGSSKTYVSYSSGSSRNPIGSSTSKTILIKDQGKEDNDSSSTSTDKQRSFPTGQMAVESSLMAGTYKAAAEATRRIRSSRVDRDRALDVELIALKASGQQLESAHVSSPSATDISSRSSSRSNINIYSNNIKSSVASKESIVSVSSGSTPTGADTTTSSAAVSSGSSSGGGSNSQHHTETAPSAAAAMSAGSSTTGGGSSNHQQSTATTSDRSLRSHHHHPTSSSGTEEQQYHPLPADLSSSSGTKKKEYHPLPADLFDGRYIMLNIGGIAPVEGWYSVNSQLQSFNKYSTAHVDIIRDMHDLQGFPDNSVAAVYASHTLEHNSFGDGKLEATLKEWQRVLKPGGLVLISVPDLRVLSSIYLDDTLPLDQRWMVTKMFYGAQTDKYDYHFVGFDHVTLMHFLQSVGFCSIERVGSFNLFQDTSELVYRGKRISLNMAAKKCDHDLSSTSTTTTSSDSFRIDHNASPYVPN